VNLKDIIKKINLLVGFKGIELKEKLSMVFSFERKQAQAQIHIKAGSSTTNWSPVSL
jgi:hypothetical protein